MKKRIIPAVLAIILTVVMITPAFAIVEPTDEFYVADYAGVLSASTEQEIIEANALLENTCEGAQIVVVAVEYLNGLYSDEYALQVMNEWGVGSASENNGMVLVFATKEGKGWLATGDGIDGSFTDQMAEDYLNAYFWHQFDSGNYDKAVSNLLSQLVDWYEYGYSSARSMNIFHKIFDSLFAVLDYILYREYLLYPIIIIVIILIQRIQYKRQHYRAYYTHMGMPIPRFHIWHMWHGPHIHWHNPNPPIHHHSSSGGYRSSGRSSGFRSSGRGGGGFGGGGGAGRR